MTNPLNTPEYYRATLKEMILRLQYPGASSALEVVQAGHVAECLLLILDRLDKLDGGHIESEVVPEVKSEVGVMRSSNGQAYCNIEYKGQAEKEGWIVSGITRNQTSGQEFCRLIKSGI